MNKFVTRISDAEYEDLSKSVVSDIVSQYVGGTTGIAFEWSEDDHTDLLIIWLASQFKDTEIKYYFWLSDYKTVAEFESSLKKKVELLHSFQTIAEGPDALCSYDYVLNVLDRYLDDVKSVSVDDFVIWASLNKAKAPGKIEIMAEGRDSYGDNYKVFKAVAEAFGDDALYKLAGVIRVLVRIYHDAEGSMFDDYWVNSPDHKTVRGLIHAAVEVNEEDSLDKVREVFGQFTSRIPDLQKSLDESM